MRPAKRADRVAPSGRDDSNRPGGSVLALAGALILPASAATAGGGLTASKSGAIINYVSGTKLKIGKRIQIVVVCSVDCNVVSKSTIKGPGVKLRGNVSGSLLAGVPGGPFFKPNGPLLKAMKATPGRVQADQQHHRDGSRHRRDRRDLAQLQAEALAP